MNNDEPLTDSARLYIGIVTCAGLAAVVHSLYALHATPVSYRWSLLAGLTLLSGSFTIRIPTIPARLSVSETFVFATVLLFGPAAATMIVVVDSLIISLWLGTRSQTPSRVLFNMAAPAASIWVASHAFYALADIPPLSDAPRPILTLLGPLIVLAVIYFLLNSALIAWAVAFQKRLSAFDVWRRNFLWLSLNYFSGASVAALLLPYLQPEKPEFARVIGMLLPLLLISYLTFKTAMGRVDDANQHLTELNRLYLSTIETLAMAIDAKDQITHGHIRRVQIQAVRLARAMGVTEDAQIRAIEAAALLHDMGKLAVPEYILNKPGPLTAAEFEKMKLHASVGADILSAIDFPYPVVPIVRHHHENWDGTGYPSGVTGAAIPIGARILSVVDCFDALTSDRPYRPRLADRDALRILVQRRGRMYDPLVVDTFLQLHAEDGYHPPQTQESGVSLARAESQSPDPQVPPFRANRLEDITASGEEMLALFELARGLTGRMNLTDAGDVIVKHLRRIVPSSLCVFYIYGVDTDELLASYASGDNTSAVAGLRISLGQRLTGWVGANRQTIRNSDPILDLGDPVRSMSPRLRSCLSTPLVADGKLVGVLSLYSVAADGFSEDHQRIIEVVASQVAPIVEQALRFDQKTVDSRDQLANIPNLDQLRLFIESHVVGAAPTSVIFIHVTAPKTNNTCLGSSVSDGVLHSALLCARRHISPADLIFRYDGNEFIVVQLQTPAFKASEVAANIRDAIETSVIRDSNSGHDQVRIGVSSAPDDGMTIESLISAARRQVALPHSGNAGNSGQSKEAVH